MTYPPIPGCPSCQHEQAFEFGPQACLGHELEARTAERDNLLARIDVIEILNARLTACIGQHVNQIGTLTAERDRYRAEAEELSRILDDTGIDAQWIRDRLARLEVLHPAPSLLDERGKVDWDAVGCEDYGDGPYADLPGTEPFEVDPEPSPSTGQEVDHG